MRPKTRQSQSCKHDRSCSSSYSLTKQHLFVANHDPMIKQTHWLPLLLVLLVSTLCCSQSHADSPVGTWRGGWHSGSTGHKGTLRARIRQTGPTTYRAMFAGRFAVVVPFVYPAKLSKVPGSCDCYTSSTKLPLLGTYRMTAQVSDHRFYATFQGKKDRGTFDMSR